MYFVKYIRNQRKLNHSNLLHTDSLRAGNSNDHLHVTFGTTKHTSEWWWISTWTWKKQLDTESGSFQAFAADKLTLMRSNESNSVSDYLKAITELPRYHSMEWISDTITPGLKQPRCEADHSPPSSAQFYNEWSYTSTLPFFFLAWCLIKQEIYLNGIVLS
jgi:hypothetical protein